MRDSTTNGLLINTKTAVHNQQWGPLDTKISIIYVDFTRKRKLFRREYKSSLDCKSETSRTLTNERRVSESLTNDETLSGSCHAQLVSQHLESLAQGRRSRSGAVRRAEQHARCGTQWCPMFISSIILSEWAVRTRDTWHWPGGQQRTMWAKRLDKIYYVRV